MRDRQAEADHARAYWRRWLAAAARQDYRVIGWGAAAKATVWLNWIGDKASTIDYIVDSTPAKHGLYVPGTDIRIHAETDGILEVFPPHFILILAANYADEIEQKASLRCPQAVITVPMRRYPHA